VYCLYLATNGPCDPTFCHPPISSRRASTPLTAIACWRFSNKSPLLPAEHLSLPRVAFVRLPANFFYSRFAPILPAFHHPFASFITIVPPVYITTQQNTTQYTLLASESLPFVLRMQGQSFIIFKRVYQRTGIALNENVGLCRYGADRATRSRRTTRGKWAWPEGRCRG
jgi:hypothetical protein